MKNLEKSLEQLNLSKNEAAVYVALLKLGQSPAGKIISETRLHRSVVYETFAKLVNRKLVFKLDKKKISYFQATSPDRILESIEAQKSLAEKLVPELKGLFDANLPEITVYEGLESYRQFWLESARKMPVGSVDYVAGSIGEKWQELMGPDTEKFIETRIKRKIKWQMVIFDRDDLEFELLKKHPLLHEYRLINKAISKKGNFNIFNDDTLVLHSTAEPMVIAIKNKNLVKVFRDLFDLLWETGTEIK